MRREHEAIDYAQEESLLGIIIYKVLAQFNGVKATKTNCCEVVLKVEDHISFEEWFLEIKKEFRGEQISINTEYLDNEVSNPEDKRHIEITLRVPDYNDFIEYIGIKDTTYTYFDDLISKINLQFNAIEKKSMDTFLSEIQFAISASENDRRSHILYQTIVKSMELIVDKNEFLAFTEYLWVLKTGSLFRFDSDKMEVVWDMRNAWIKNCTTSIIV